jgi:hypothetical protein
MDARQCLDLPKRFRVGERKTPSWCRVHSGCPAPEKCRDAGHCLDLAETLSPDQ